MGLREMDVGVGAIDVRLFHGGDPSAAWLLEAMAMASVVAATRDEGGARGRACGERKGGGIGVPFARSPYCRPHASGPSTKAALSSIWGGLLAGDRWAGACLGKLAPASCASTAWPLW